MEKRCIIALVVAIYGMLKNTITLYVVIVEKNTINKKRLGILIYLVFFISPFHIFKIVFQYSFETFHIINFILFDNIFQNVFTA